MAGSRVPRQTTVVLRMNQNRYKTKRNNELNIRIRFRDGFLVVKGNR